jgi:site-specific DNA recombinase
MLKDCQSRDIEIILTKSISRFGRDTVEILDALNQLRILGVRVIFEQEVLDTADTDNDLMISIIESIAQAENESRSDNIKWGIKQHAAQGTSKLYNRKCYGYYNDEDGNLAIDEKEAKKEMTHLPYFYINLSRFRYINMNVNIFTRQSCSLDICVADVAIKG